MVGQKINQVYLYSAFHNIDCIKAASQYQSKHNNVRFLVEKLPHLVEMINGINDLLINLNIPNYQTGRMVSSLPVTSTQTTIP